MIPLTLAPPLPPTLQPFSGVYYTWKNAAVPGSKVQVPTWVLAFGGVGIVTGLATYGWHIMGLYGAKSVMISNCRGFSIELATALTVIFAARFGEPHPWAWGLLAAWTTDCPQRCALCLTFLLCTTYYAVPSRSSTRF